MTYDPDLWRMPQDRIWALENAAAPGGWMPHARSTVEFIDVLESEGLLRQSECAPFWHITDKGRAELERLKSTVTSG